MTRLPVRFEASAAGTKCGPRPFTILRRFALGLGVSLLFWHVGDTYGLFDKITNTNAEGTGPLRVEEHVKILMAEDITPKLLEREGIEDPRLLIGRPAIDAQKAVWTMDCPLVVVSRGWLDHGNLRPAAGARGIGLPDGSTFVLRDMRANRSTAENLNEPEEEPALIIPGDPPKLDYDPPLFASIIDVPENLPCTKPLTGQTWHGSMTVVLAAIPVVKPL